MFTKVSLLFALFLVASFAPKAIRAADDDAVDANAVEEFAVELDPETFDAKIEAGNVFVKFFAPWCGHCKRLHPLWEQLAELMNIKDDPKVIIAKVDCTKHQNLCNKYEVTGYPTLRLFKKGVEESIKFKGTRDLPAITDFINQHLNDVETNIETGLKSETDDATDDDAAAAADAAAANANVGKVVELNEDTFAKHVSSGNHFVKFFAPWCSHCQRLAPTWEELAKSLQHETAVVISKIDCTQFRPICQDFEVKGYPTLLWIEDGKKIEKYSGGRDHDTLKAYIEKMLGASSVNSAEAQQQNSDVKPTEATKTEEEVDKLQVIKLNGENFAETIADGVVFIKFYAPWCGHCQKLSPTWDQLAAKVHSGKSGIRIAKIDCTETENKQICIEQEIEGYPSLFAYKNGERQSEYDGTRSLPELQHYINKFVGHDEL